MSEHTHRLPADVLVARILDARNHTLRLVSDLSDDQLELPYLEVVNPFRWEMGHVASSTTRSSSRPWG